MTANKKRKQRNDIGQSHQNHKILKLPRKYNAGFLADYDKRTQLYYNLSSSYNEVVSDLGGEERLSHIQKTLAQKFVFLEFQIEQLERRLVTNPKKASKLLGKWIYAVQRLGSLSGRLGLERRRKVIESNLKDYIGKRRKHA